jgi:hypothetical protein
MNPPNDESKTPGNGNTDPLDPVVIIDETPGDTTIRPRRHQTPKGWPWQDLSSFRRLKKKPDEPKTDEKKSQ